MSVISALDSLEEYLNEYQYLVNSFHKAYLLITRYKLNYGQDGFELLALCHESDREGNDDCDDIAADAKHAAVDKNIIRNRKNQQPAHNTATPFTKKDHIDYLKTAFHSLLHDKIIPLAHFKQKLASQINEIK